MIYIASLFKTMRLDDLLEVKCTELWALFF